MEGGAGSHSQADTEIGRDWGEGLPAKSSQLWLLIGNTWGGLRTLPTPASWVPAQTTPQAQASRTNSSSVTG